MPAKYEESLLGTPSRGGNDCQRVVPGPAVGRSEVPPDGHPQYRLSVPQYTITTTMYALNSTERRETQGGKRIKAKIVRAKAVNVPHSTSVARVI